jgi:Protein of unknown function (DUF938)
MHWLSHIVARNFRALVFQPSDPEPDALLSVAAWVGTTRVTNVRAPIALDTSHSVWPIASADGIICINMAHISPWEATLGLIKGAAAILPSASPLYLYGPYMREAFATAPSNQAFNRSLRDRNPTWGLRDLEALTAIAQSVGFVALGGERAYMGRLGRASGTQRGSRRLPGGAEGIRTNRHRTMPLVWSETMANTAHSPQTLPSPSPFTPKPIRLANLRAEGAPIWSVGDWNCYGRRKLF